MSDNLHDTWEQDFALFKEKTDAFYAGQMERNRYKSFSGEYGSYAQRGGDLSMLRLRLTGGRLTKEKLKFICECIEKYHVRLIHLTTCQTIQLHNLPPVFLYDIMEAALQCGIVTMGGGGDYPRNIMVSPLSGVEEGEYFDVLRYAEAAEPYVLSFIKGPKMPRKLKIGFSNGLSNTTHVTFRDLGFLARPDGTFDVYSAGGLGRNPKLGIPVARQVPPSEILYHICAMRNTFLLHGNYENRGKARTRYMQETLGREGFIRAYQEQLRAAFAEHKDLYLPCSSAAPVQTHKKEDLSLLSGPRIIKQKQPGLYAVSYHPIGGCPVPAKFSELYSLIEEIEDAELRLSPDQGMYLINLPAEKALEIQAATSDGAHTALGHSVACIGASVCQIGLQDSQQLLRRILDKVAAAGIDTECLPQIHISGCPSSCGTHQIGTLGFHGCVKMIDKKAVPAFTLHILGNDTAGRERFGTEAGAISETDIPAFLIDLARDFSSRGIRLSEYPSGLEEEHLALIVQTARKYTRS